ncbi:MAG: asparaginase [Anaerolineae bacterium]|jgi:L-asparaginase|nr:asparaginase [Anaerolineae bacterium]MBT7070863.1 asparaginase [Anaerolineae bacterium]MBT7326417.1 asparaginase [Anaerolineae bacterium]
MQPIKIFTTGGTIDKVYFDAKSTYEVGAPNIERVLAELPLNIDYTVTSILRKDSLEITTADRNVVVAACRDAEERQIIVTHGTDTMVETAKALQEAVKDKTIVLTGALEPALFKTSDAMFNIGCAIAAVQSLPPGAYITMNGRIFESGNVIKDLELSRFVTLNDME